MSYIGNPVVSTDFPKDTFSGNGSTTAFTLSVAPASVNAVIVIVSGVTQDPSTYTISGTTLTFSAAPPSGTSNISVRHLGIAGIPNTPSAASVVTTSIAANAVTPAKMANGGAEFGMRNRIINGAMAIDQRNAGASGSSTYAYVTDRFFFYGTQSGKITYGQNLGSVTPPAGFIKYLGFSSSSSYSVTSSDRFIIGQPIEGFNFANLGFGTANASAVTLSFKVYSSLTGTFGGSLQEYNGTRSYPFTYTVSSSNTWTNISITIQGDTSGSWATNNAGAAAVIFSLGCGSTFSGTAGTWAGTNYNTATGATSVVGTNGATFYITGVQLEKGTTATEFDYRPYGTELALCQRYYWETPNETVYSIVGQGQHNTTQASIVVRYPQQMRAAPSISALGTNAGSWTVQMGSTNIQTGSTAFASAWGSALTSHSAWLDFAPISGGTAGYAITLFRGNQSTSNKNGCLAFSAEL